jgi:hypothetical protein
MMAKGRQPPIQTDDACDRSTDHKVAEPAIVAQRERLFRGVNFRTRLQNSMMLGVSAVWLTGMTIRKGHYQEQQLYNRC